MKKICILLQNQYDSDIRVRRKAEALIEAGYSVDVLALRSAANTKEYTLGDVRVFTVGLGKKRGSLARYSFEYAAFFIWAFWKLFWLMSGQDYDVIDVNNLPDFLVFAAAYAKWRGAKVVFDMHEITPEFYVSKYGIGENSWVTRWLKWIERRSFKFADRVITINEPIQKLLESRGLKRSNSTVVMNAADEAMFEAARTTTAVERRPGFVMMYHGTMTQIYGLDIALEAFGRARPQMPGAEFWILGKGPEQSRLMEQAQRLGLNGSVKFLGTVPPEKIPGWLSQCDAGVLATRRDVFLDYSFSNKLSEYVVMGKPVISSRLKTIASYFSDQALAYFEPNNAEQLAREMVRVYGDAALRTRLARQAAQEYAPISWGVMKERYLAMMAELLGRDAKPQIAEPPATPAGSV